MEQQGRAIGKWSQINLDDQFAKISSSSETGKGRHTTGSGKFG
jgi:hypothetical protein